jgi:glycosyltransferase involved in cell wall biosynthesis
LDIVSKDFKLPSGQECLDYRTARSWQLVAKMKDSPLISILISAYNEELYIQECIDSCLNQTYDPIEIILVNDGSTDRTSEIINLNYKNNHKIQIIELENNRGKVNGFNLAFAASQGKYLAIMGADDICYPRRIEISLKHLSDQYGLVCSDLDKINSSGKIIEKNIVHNQHGSLDLEHFSTKNLIEKPKVFGGTLFFTRQLADRLFPLDIHLSHEDWYIPIKASLYTKIGYIDEPLIAYRMHSNNASSNAEKFFYDYAKWLYLNTRNIAYLTKLIELVNKFPIDTDVDEIRFNLARSLLLKSNVNYKTYFEYLPEIKGLKRKILFSLHLFPHSVYFLVIIRRLKNYCIKKITKPGFRLI